MAQIEVSDMAVSHINKIVENAEQEKAAIADALTTAVENMQCNIDQSEYLNICAVLGRYNRLVSLLAEG